MGADQSNRGVARSDLLTHTKAGCEMAGRLTQPSLLGPTPTPEPPREWDGIAHVIIDSPLPHLDHPFDYGIPAELAATAQVGSRVRVRFAGRHADGFIIGLSPASAHAELKPLLRVLGEVPVVSPDVLELSTRLARAQAGGVADVLRLAIPPRHATTERDVMSGAAPPAEAAPPDPSPEPWEAYPAGEAFLRRLGAGQSPRAVWSALPTPAHGEPQEWIEAIASATLATLASGRGVLILAPTLHDLMLLRHGLSARAIPHVELTAELGPAARYRNFLTALLGHTRVVVGTRAAAYAPVTNLGLVVCWDELDESYNEPRAPYPHARQVLALRAEIARAGALFGGYARSPEAQQLLATGWAHHLGAPRATVRERTSRITLIDEYDRDREGGVGHARIPGMAFRRIRTALEHGPVLIQVPRRGHAPGLACANCRNTARCATCHGPLRSNPTPQCAWCAQTAQDWRCPSCGRARLRARSVGAERTAEELGRAFPGVPVRVSGAGSGRLEEIGATPALIVATPGAEPPARDGYPLAVLLDGHLLTDLPFLTAPIQALHKWLRAAALTTGEVLLLGDPLTAPAQAAVRWDPGGYAQRVLQEWTELNFPPAFTVVTVTGERADLLGFERYLPTGLDLTTFGPVRLAGQVDSPQAGELSVPVHTPRHQLLLRVPAAQHFALTDGVRAAVRTRSAHRAGAAVQVKVNPTKDL